MSGRRPPSVLIAGLACVMAMAVGATGAPSRAQEPSSLPPEAVAIIESLRDLEPATGHLDMVPPAGVVDEGAPAVLIPRALERIEALRDGLRPNARRHLEQALRALDDAWSAFTGGGRTVRDPSDLTHLHDTLPGLRRAVAALGLAGLRARDASAEIRALQASLTAAAERIARDVHDIANDAGVSSRRLAPIAGFLGLADDAADAGRFVAAIALFDAALRLAGNTIDFDIDAFEQNILDALDGETIGYTYAITLFDTVHASDGLGEARIAPDGTPEAQQPTKEMHLASVSKTLTAILVLWLLEENGLTPDAPIGPWLPAAWVRGDDVDQQTFRDFLTHETGFTQKGVAPATVPTYANLQAAIAIDVPFNTSWNYNNSNFGLFRVLVPALAGFDLEAFPQYDDDELTAGLFVFAALNFFEAVDAHATCNPDQPNRTLYYSQPHNGTNGLATSDFSLECGGYGFYMSSDDLGAILAGLTVGDELLSDASWDLMRAGQLGLFDPANPWYPWGNGGLGLYHNHGGDWTSGIKGLDVCVMIFPNGVSAALQINSIGGNYPYQCEVLRAAFDGAWVPS